MRSVDRCFGTHCRGKPFIGYADAGDGAAFSDGFAERINPEAERIERNFIIFAKILNSFFRALGSIQRAEYGIGAAPGSPGADGVGGDVFSAATSAAPVLTLDEFLAEPDEIDVLLSLGPMTVTKEVLSRRTVKEFLFMAGCVDGIPNYHGYEFNHGLNKEAFAFAAKFPHRAILLDAACKALDVQHLPLAGTDLFTRAIKKYRDLGISRGETTCTVWDDVAVLALLYPALFSEQTKTDRDGNVLHVLSYTANGYPGVHE